MKTVAVDLDGVLAHCVSGQGATIGAPIVGAKEFLRDLSRVAYVLIHTARLTRDPSDYTKVRQWFLDNDMMFNEIWVSPGKPVADAYIDDRAVHVFSNSPNFQAALYQTNELLRRHDVHNRGLGPSR